MITNGTKWSPQEQKRLKEIRQSLNGQNEKNWTLISSLLNSEFRRNRTSKQCREKYVNYLRYDKETDQYDWTSEQLHKLIQLYIENGTSWTSISQQFNKSQNCIKNKFNNSIRRIVKKLNHFQAEAEVHCRSKVISTELLVSMLDFTNKIHQKNLQRETVWNKKSELYQFRLNLLRLSLLENESSNQQLVQFLKLVGRINSRLRSFGVYKVKNRKLWKLSDECFGKFMSYDNIFEEKIIHASTQSIFNPQNSNQSKSLSEYDDLESLCLDEIKYHTSLEESKSLITQVNLILGHEEQVDHFGDFL